MPEPIVPDDDPMTPDMARRYWNENVRLIGVLLSVWFSVSILGGILFVETLNKVTLGKLPLGFWLGHQGSIVIFVILIGIYVLMMDRLDKKYGIRRD